MRSSSTSVRGGHLTFDSIRKLIKAVLASVGNVSLSKLQLTEAVQDESGKS